MIQSYEKNKILGLLYRIFQAENYTWAFESNPPSFEDIEKEVNRLEETAYENGIVESGRIRIEYDKECKVYDYYLNLGSD